MFPCIRTRLGMLLAATVLAACAPAVPSLAPSGANDPSRPAALIPYHTATASITPPPPPPGTPTPLPSPTATPRTHVVAAGEDLGGIAYRYHISLDALLSANPDVNPNAMSIGTTLVIPGGAAPTATGVPVPTALPLRLQPVTCSRGQEGGLWCFALVKNNKKTWVENISAIIRVADGKTGKIVSQTALPPLDLLAPGASLPLSAYFPPPAPQTFHAGAELIGAMPLGKDSSSRYLSVGIDQEQVRIDPGGLFARVTGEVSLKEEKRPAGLVWVAAVAYTQDGQVAGVRRWEMKNPPSEQRQIPFDFEVYSTGPVITRVELQAEARPGSAVVPD